MVCGMKGNTKKTCPGVLYFGDFLVCFFVFVCFAMHSAKI